MKNNLLLIIILFLNFQLFGQTKNYVEVEQQLSTKTSKGLVVAHRSDWRNFPENSIEGVKNCIELGVDIVEIDVRITSDNEIVVLHDKTLDRVSNGTGKVSHSSLSQIKELYLKNGYGILTDYKIPTLEEVLKVTKNKVHVMIDKAYYILPQVWEVVKKVGVENQVMFEGSVPVDEFIQTYPKLIKEIQYMPRIAPETKEIENYMDGYLSYVKVPMFITSFEKMDKAFLDIIKKYNDRGIMFMASSLDKDSAGGKTDDKAIINPEDNWGWILRNGFKVICTDRPQELKEFITTKSK